MVSSVMTLMVEVSMLMMAPSVIAASSSVKDVTPVIGAGVGALDELSTLPVDEVRPVVGGCDGTENVEGATVACAAQPTHARRRRLRRRRCRIAGRFFG